MPVDYGTDKSVYRNGGIGKRIILINYRENLLEAIQKRLTTPRGWLAKFGGDPDYGYDVSSLLHAKFTPARILAEEVQIKVECEKDDRIRSAEVSITQATRGDIEILRITIEVTPKGSGPFKAVAEIGVSIPFSFIEVKE